MTESLHVSEAFYEFVETHNGDDETVEETLRRLVGGPRPESVAGTLSSETATEMRDRLEVSREADVARKRELRERFE